MLVLFKQLNRAKAALWLQHLGDQIQSLTLARLENKFAPELGLDC